VKPAPFELFRPGSLGEALGLLAEHGDEAKPLAGGQSLVPVLNMRLLRPAVLVDLNSVPGLAEVERVNGHIRVGALVRQRALERDAAVAGALPLVAQALPYVGHVATRNRGTVGGSLAHADPGAELPLCLTALGGSVVAASADGRREIAADDFFVAHFTTTLQQGELLVESLWPVLGSGYGFAFEELAQRRGDFGLASAACVLRVEAGVVAEARVMIGSVTHRPLLVDTGLEGRRGTAEEARSAGERAVSGLELFDNLHASADYQRQLTSVLVARAVERAFADAGART
jgi:CO/xanthine dehydrogenase FAD-binding subunit